MEPLEVLSVAPGGEPGIDLPGELLRLYGGPLDLRRPALFANFVQSLDGVVALAGVRSPGSAIGAHSEADRMVMGILRAAADTVLVGGATLREVPGHRWTPQAIYPPLAGAYAELREHLGLTPDPGLIVVSGSGDLDPAHPALRAGARIVTTPAGARALPAGLASCEVQVLDPLEPAGLGLSGGGRVLSEAGPTLTHQLLAAGMVSDLFVTLSPVLVGMGRPPATGLAGRDPLPAWQDAGALASVRRAGSHLFLHYQGPG